MITKRKFITYQMPGTFFAEEHTEEVQSFDPPNSVPLDCFGFHFHETEYAQVEGKEFEGKTKRDKRQFLIGFEIPLDQIPDDDKHRILKCNIESNSPTKTAVKTHLGNWQAKQEDTVVIFPSDMKFTKPLIWKNITSEHAKAA